MAKIRQKHPDGVFWSAYSRLEQFNYQVFDKLSPEFDGSLQPGVKSRYLAAVSSVALRVMPQVILKSVYKRTKSYVGQLETLYELSPSQHKSFFDYVVRQEEAQIVAIEHAINKNYALGAEVLDRFVATSDVDELLQSATE